MICDLCEELCEDALSFEGRIAESGNVIIEKIVDCPIRQKLLELSSKTIESTDNLSNN